MAKEPIYRRGRRVEHTKPMTFHAYYFIVEGEGHFPADMLSNDRCVPYTSQDVVTAFYLHVGMRKVSLWKFVERGSDPTPSTEEWEARGWSVVKDSMIIIPE